MVLPGLKERVGWNLKNFLSCMKFHSTVHFIILLKQIICVPLNKSLRFSHLNNKISTIIAIANDNHSKCFHPTIFLHHQQMSPPIKYRQPKCPILTAIFIPKPYSMWSISIVDEANESVEQSAILLSDQFQNVSFRKDSYNQNFAVLFRYLSCGGIFVWQIRLRKWNSQSDWTFGK